MGFSMTLENLRPPSPPPLQHKHTDANVNWSFDDWRTLQFAITRSGVELIMLGINLLVFLVLIVFEIRTQIVFYKSKTARVNDEGANKKGMDRGVELKSMLKKMDFDV